MCIAGAVTVTLMVLLHHDLRHGPAFATRENTVPLYVPGSSERLFSSCEGDGMQVLQDVPF